MGHPNTRHEATSGRRWAGMFWAAAVAAALGAAPMTHGEESVAATRPEGPAATILGSMDDPALKELAQDVLERNPRIAGAKARARAAREHVRQAEALPDPMLGATGFVSSPETRVGPQTVAGMLSQKLPWFGKLGLKGQAALQQAAALDAQAEALRLELLTETRRLYHEIGFLDAWREAVVADRETLLHYEELARTRYASGAGIAQAVIKIQAEITKDDTRLLEIDNRRAALVAALNSLRDRPQDTTVAPVTHGAFLEVAPDPGALRLAALRSRPEIERADADLARAQTMIDLARKGYKPDLTLVASYTRVGLRDDPAGIATPPPDNGQDVFAVSATINLPIHRGRLAAAVREAAEMRRAAAEEKRAVVTSVDRALGELVERVRLTWQQLRLFEDVLGVQADQSLRSAEASYASGQLNSLDLLDAERVLLDVRTATERTRADHAIALARLEGAVAEPLPKNQGASQR